MKFSAFKIIIVTTILSVLGFLVVPQLSLRLNPSSRVPSITVTYNWANAPSYVLDRDITSILESGLSTLSGLQNINSRSSYGAGSINLQFDKYTDIQVARFEVSTTIRQLFEKLPKRTTYPIIIVNKPDNDQQHAFLTYNISANDIPFNIQEVVNRQIAPQIGAINGVDKAIVYGANPKEFLLTYNHKLLERLGLSKTDIQIGITNSYNTQSLGKVNFTNEYISLSVEPQFNSINWHIPIKKVDSKIIFLDELVVIKEQEQEATNYYRVNGENAITLAIYATANANTIELAELIDHHIENNRKNLPSGYSIQKSYDSTVYLKEELSRIYERSIYTVLILLLFILVINQSLRYLLVTIICIMANIFIAILFYFAFDIEIQLYSLAGITISLGLIVDNSIVMIDHVKQKKNKTVFLAILASTLTTIGAFSIIYFLDEPHKTNLIDFTYVIIINLIVSLLIALFLIPALLDKIKFRTKKENKWLRNFKKHFYKIYHRIIYFELRFKKLFIFGLILIFGLPSFMLPQKLDSNDTWYEKTYNYTLGNEWYLENVRPSLDQCLGGSFRLFSRYVFDNAHYSNNEQTKLYIDASMEKGSTVHQMNAVFIELDNYLSNFVDIKRYNTTVYSGDYASLEITFENKNDYYIFPSSLKSKLIKKVQNFGGIDWNIYGVGQGYRNGGNFNDPISFAVKAKGYDYNTLNIWMDSLKVMLQKHPRIQNAIVRENSFNSSTPSYEYQFSLNKELLGRANIAPKKVIDELKGLTLSKSQEVSININGRYSSIRFESEDAKSYDIWHINNTPLNNFNSPLILGDVSNVTKKLEDENIYKENQEYVKLIEFQYNGETKFGLKFLNNELEKLKEKLPLGFNFNRSEEHIYFNKDEKVNYIFFLILILSIIYLICSILFESLKQPLIIISVIPISFIGVFLTFYIFDFNFDQGGMVSFVLLSGISVNASIFILNSFNQLRKAFPDKDYLILYIEAFKQKIFPIFLTTISTVVGFIPFIIDGQSAVFWFALGAGTIGGLVFSLIGIFFYLPIFTLKNENLKYK